MKKRRKRSPLWTLIILAAVAVLTVLLSLCFGAAALSPSDLFSALIRGELTSPALRIFLYVRLPRTLGALLSGAALAVSGAILQIIMNNPLAGPNIVGVNAGAGLGVLIALAAFPQLTAAVPIGAFVGAFGCTLLIFFLAKFTGASKTAVVLAGVAISGIVSAFSAALRTLFDDLLPAYTGFTVGSLNGVTVQKLLPALPGILIGIAVTALLSRELKLLSLGEDTAVSLGLRVPRLRLGLMLLSSLLAASAVSIAGAIGFVGLLAPHAVRKMLGSEPKWLIPGCALLGGTAVMLGDLLGRVLFAPFEMPVGILLSVLGGGYFLWLLCKRRDRA